MHSYWFRARQFVAWSNVVVRLPISVTDVSKMFPSSDPYFAFGLSNVLMAAF